MKCEEFEAVMVDYLDNKLEEERKREIEKHLESCEKCLDELKDVQQVLKLISRDTIEKPDDSMRINFYHMLHSELNKNEARKISSSHNSPDRWYNRSIYRYAAGIALLLGGTFLGIIIYSLIVNSSQGNKLTQLQSEVTALKKAAMFTMLKEESSSNRILAVSYADDIETPDQNIIDALVKTLNTDKNVNVRLSAAYALSKFAGQRSVSDSLVKSLTHQTDPILQVTLINILVDRKERSALNPIQRIIKDENTLKEVKTIAEEKVKMLI